MAASIYSEKVKTGSPPAARAPASAGGMIIAPLPESRRVDRGTWRRRRWVLPLLSMPLVLLLLVPLVGLVLRTSPAGLARSLGDRETIQALVLSLYTSACATVLVTIFGTPLALIAARRRFVGRSLLDVLVDLPTVLPPAVAGLALLMAFGRSGLLGPVFHVLGVQVEWTPIAVIMAQAFVAAPYYVKTAAVGLAGVSRDLEDAANLDGASPAQTFRLVTVPLAWRALIGGAALCWARALGEFGATIIFAGNYPGRTQTMPLAVYIGFEIDLNQALTLAVILLTLSFAILLAVRATLRGVQS